MVTIEFAPFDLLAVLGALTGVSALLWQIITWRRGTHRVRVKVSNAFMATAFSEVEHRICITAHNVGAMAVDVVSYGVTAADGGSLHDLRPLQPNGQTPHRLEPGSNVAYFMSADYLREYHAQSGFPFSRMRPWVRLGTGQQVFARRTVPLKD